MHLAIDISRQKDLPDMVVEEQMGPQCHTRPLVAWRVGLEVSPRQSEEHNTEDQGWDFRDFSSRNRRAKHLWILSY